jgi:uncharacterized protein involved in exopolysaccharide biosynthesis
VAGRREEELRVNRTDLQEVYRDPDMFDVKTSLGRIGISVRAHKGLVIVTTLITLALVQVYIHIWPPVFEAEAMIMAEQAVDTQRDAFYVNWNVFRKDDPRTEIELITSGGVLKQVIDKENLKYDDVYHPPMTEVSYLWEQSWLGRHYTAIKEKFFPPDPELPKGDNKDFGRTLSDLHAGIKVAPVGDSSIGRLTLKGPSRRVAHIANTLLTSYMEDRQLRHEEEARRAVDVLGVAMEEADRELRAADARRVAYAQSHNLVFGLQKEVQDAHNLNDLDIELVKGRERVATLRANLKQIDADLAAQPEQHNVSTAVELNGVRESLKMKRLELQAGLATTKGRYRDDSPEIQEIQTDIAKLDKMIAAEPEQIVRGTTTALNTVRQTMMLNRNGVESELQGQLASLAVMEETAARLRNSLVGTPEMEETMRDQDREYSMAQEKYQALKLKRAEALVSLTTVKTSMQSLRVVDFATPPASKSWPRLKYLYPGGLLAGLLLGVLAAMIKNMIDGKVYREDLMQGRTQASSLLAIIGRNSGAPALTVLPPASETTPGPLAKVQR